MNKKRRYKEKMKESYKFNLFRLIKGRLNLKFHLKNIINRIINLKLSLFLNIINYQFIIRLVDSP